MLAQRVDGSQVERRRHCQVLHLRSLGRTSEMRQQDYVRTVDVRKKSRFAGEMGMVGPHFVSARGGGSAWCGFTRYRIGVSLLLFD